jgi:hypothetical protein
MGKLNFGITEASGIVNINFFPSFEPDFNSSLQRKSGEDIWLTLAWKKISDEILTTDLKLR